MLTDPYDDQDAYHLHFRYPGQEPHAVVALIDRNIGGICKDAFCGTPMTDIRAKAERFRGTTVTDVDPAKAAAAILRAIEIGDDYLDNDWTPEFKQTRALLRSRAHSLHPGALPDLPTPINETEREIIVNQFISSTEVADPEVAERIASLALDYACDYTPDSDPFRWSPIVVDCFLLGWLPRKALLDTGEIRAMADVLKTWVAFALERRGLAKALTDETKQAVDRFMPEFRRAATDQRNFGPAKSLVSAMMASGVDPTDQDAVGAWIDDFNRRPFEQRDELLGPSLFDPD